jgi:TRAP-type C4-dicarboxylate transport system substrate-binding protein
MKKQLWVVVLAMTLLGMLFAACQPAGPTPEKPIELSYSNFFPPTHGNSVAAESWIAEIEKRTGGRVKITYYPGGTLTPADQCYDGVVEDISDIGMTCLAYTRGRFPFMEGVDLPLGYPSGTVATRIVNEIYHKYMPEELADTHMLYLHAHGPGLLHTKDSVKTLEDLNGMKVRCTGLAAKIVEALGGTPVAMSQGETYEALQKGTVSGTFGPIEVLEGWKQAEVIDYTTNCYQIGYTTTFWVGMNLEKWESLPKDIQDVFTEVSEEWVEVHAKVWDDADAAGKEYTLSQGNEIVELSAEEADRWIAAVQALPDQYIADMQAVGLPGTELIDEVRRLIGEYSQ